MFVILYSMLSTAVQPTAQSLCVGACVSDLKEEVNSLLKTILPNFIRAQFIAVLFVA
jgi:chemotaxis receptor (MCP) glutamine deamidase CheD